MKNIIREYLANNYNMVINTDVIYEGENQEGEKGIKYEADLENINALVTIRARIKNDKLYIDNINIDVLSGIKLNKEVDRYVF